jgi:protoporphyrinogen oxidase
MDTDVLIVGGGLTGMTAAYRLAKISKLRITVLEREAVLGGLAAGFRLEGTNLERTYHHLFLTDSSILSLVKELGLEDKLQWRNSSLSIYRDGRIWPFMTPGDLLRFRPCSVGGRFRLGLVGLYLKYQRNWRPLARVAAATWMRRYCGASAMRSIWSPLLQAKFARHAERVYMAWLWARLHIRTNSRKAGAQGEQLGYFHGGFAVLIDELERRLIESGVAIHRGIAVQSLGPNRKCTLANGECISYGQCLFTGASSTFAQLLPADPALAEYRSRLLSIGYLGAVCLVFSSEQDVGDQYWLNINQAGAPFLVFINHTKLIDRQAYNGKCIYYLGGYFEHDAAVFREDDRTLQNTWLDYLKRIYPEFDSAALREIKVFRYRNAQHIADVNYIEKIPPYKTPLPGLWLANFSQIFPEDRGTNYAVREGNKVAHLIFNEAACAS